MAIQDKNNGSSERDEDRKNQSSSWGKEGREQSNAFGASSGEGKFREDSPGNNNSFDVRASAGGRQSSYGGADAERGDQANEWQPVGDSDANVQHWWDSGTRQQQQFFGGDTQYPYRENDWGRNREGPVRVQNFYPREPASSEQRENFAEGSQYLYKGGYGAENPLAREGLERAEKLEGSAGSENQSYENISASGRQQNQFRNQNQVTNQNQNTMRPDDRNYRGDYNDYRNEAYERGRGRSRDRDYGNGRGMPDQQHDREYGRVRFNQRQDFGRDRGDYDRRSHFERDARQYGYNNNQRFGNDQSGAHGDGRYHSTRTDVPGRGFDREREMRRHENRGGRDRFIDDRGYLGDRNYRVFSSHRTTGNYDDFERDIDRFGVRDDYEERGNYPGRDGYGRGRERNENLDSYSRFGEEGARRPGPSARMRNRDMERNQRQPDYRRDRDLGYNGRYEDERNRY
jgi:hypothetical protein